MEFIWSESGDSNAGNYNLEGAKERFRRHEEFATILSSLLRHSHDELCPCLTSGWGLYVIEVKGMQD